LLNAPYLIEYLKTPWNLISISLLRLRFRRIFGVRLIGVADHDAGCDAP
jgi:hypothetical protein